MAPRNAVNNGTLPVYGPSHASRIVPPAEPDKEAPPQPYFANSLHHTGELAENVRAQAWAIKRKMFGEVPVAAEPPPPPSDGSHLSALHDANRALEEALSSLNVIAAQIGTG